MNMTVFLLAILAAFIGSAGGFFVGAILYEFFSALCEK